MIGLTTDQTLTFVLPSTSMLEPNRQLSITARFASARQTLVIRRAISRAIDTDDDTSAIEGVAKAVLPVLASLTVGGVGIAVDADTLMDRLTLGEIAELAQAYLLETSLAESDRKNSGWQSRLAAAKSASDAGKQAAAKS